MEFPNNLYLLAFASAFATSLLTIPLWRAWAKRLGLVDDPGERKIHSDPIPLAGGFGVLAGLLLPLCAGAMALELGWIRTSAEAALAYGLSQRTLQLVAILAGALGMVGLGVVDDRRELSAVVKFAGQALIAVLVAAAGVRITLFVQHAWFSYTVTVLWILTITNAFNFMDNMNGAAGGIGALAAAAFALAAARHGQYLVALIGFLIAGSLCGFLPHNFPRAKVFLGDAGSHLAGYLLAVLGILPHFYRQDDPQKLAVLSPLLILAVPLMDLTSVVLIRWQLGKPFYVGDNNHLSHQLVRRGLSRVTAVLLLWLATLLCGGLALWIFD